MSAIEEIITNDELIKILGLTVDDYHILEENDVPVCVGTWIKLAPNNWIFVGDEDE